MIEDLATVDGAGKLVSQVSIVVSSDPRLERPAAWTPQSSTKGIEFLAQLPVIA